MLREFMAFTQEEFSPVWIALAFLLAPIFGYATALVPFFGFGGLIMTAVFGGLPLVYLSAFVLGLPLFILLKRKHYCLARHFAIGGIFCALPVLLWFIAMRIKVWFLFSSTMHIITADLSFFLCLLGIGLCSGLWFWVIGIWLPNRTQVDALKRAP